MLSFFDFAMQPYSTPHERLAFSASSLHNLEPGRLHPQCLAWQLSVTSLLLPLSLLGSCTAAS